MKNKLFLSLSILTSAFAVQASPSSDVINRMEATTLQRLVSKTKVNLNVAKIALANGLTAASNKTVAGYNASKAFVVANPKKSAGIAAGSAALVAATVYLYKKGYLKSPFAQAAKKAEVKSVESKKETPVATPVVKAPVKKAKKQVKTPVVKKESRTRRAINKVKAKFARKK